MQKYLITGVAGFIGSNLLKRLLDDGHIVVGLDNFSLGNRENLSFVADHKNGSNFTFIEGDICDLSACQNACKGVDFVLHQAALGSVPRSIEKPLLYTQNNIEGTANMLVAARDQGVKRFVFASSSSVYGDTPTLPKIESMPSTPKSPYALSKLSGEYYCKLFYELYGLPTVMLRYFNIFGPKQSPESDYAAAIPRFITALLNGQSPTVYGDGEQTRDFTYVENAVNANLLACQSDESAWGRAYNIGCGHAISVNELLKSIQACLGSDIRINYTDPRAGDVRDSLASVDLAKQYLKIADMVHLDAGLRDTIAWYKDVARS